MYNFFKNKYRIDSARAKFWLYNQSALYFITICTENRYKWFGEIKNDRVFKSLIGEIAENEWLKTFELRKDMNLFKGEHIVMPNHFHAIIGIGENEYNKAASRDAMHRVSTENKFGPQSKNLASIVRGFKSAVTNQARREFPSFKWQERYHDHIIRDTESFYHISNYILNNPKNWETDKFYQKHNF